MQDYLRGVVTEPFTLCRPDDLPGTTRELSAAAALVRPGTRMVTGPGARRDLGALLAALGEARSAHDRGPVTPVGEDPAESDLNKANDLGFGILRVRGEPVRVLTDAALRSAAAVLDLAARNGAGFERTTWRRLVGGFDALLLWLADPGRAPAACPVPAPGERQPLEPGSALRRWIYGHHVFMVFSQGCSLSLACLRERAAAGDGTGAAAAAATAVRLMWASQGALSFAGDVAMEDYATEIRPTLMPPIAPPRMTGLHWRDHEALVRELAAARDAWQWLAGSRPELLEEFRSAIDSAYSAHRGVCASFVGDRSPSLLATSRSSRPAVAVLEQFHRRRLDMLPPSARRDGDGR
ncbi:hypothetical protein [Nonomuraea typhae]|uniref:Uncharacterized protein n=1 Tax=Nonomuraea typhae TaxID=2603600 RepID=A0ABW7ZAK5_9ACTN